MTLPETPCQILSLGCFGCCGRNFSPRKEVEQSIHINTERWRIEKQNIGTHLTLREYTFSHKALRTSGVCPHVIAQGEEKEKQFVCSVHPIIHKEEVREGYCNTAFLCEAAQAYKEMNEQEKHSFVLFLKKKIAAGMDSYTYSMLNAEDKLIAVFHEHEQLVK